MWSLEDEQFISNSYKTLTDKEMAQVLKKTREAVFCKRYRLKLFKGPKEWTEEENAYLLDNYRITDNAVLAQELGRSIIAIRDRAVKLGVQKDTYIINHSFFSEIDSEIKAYTLGLLWADGHVAKYRSSYYVKISLQEQDGYVIECFNTAMDSTYPVNYFSRPDRSYKMATLQITSEQMFLDLCRLGVIPRKSKQDTPFPSPPSLDINLVHHFVRGLFDGDGSIVLIKRNDWAPNPRVSITNGAPTCEWLLHTTQRLLSVGGSVYTYKKKYPNWYLWGTKQVRKFSDWLYQDATLFLTRKKEIFQQIGMLGGLNWQS